MTRFKDAIDFTFTLLKGKPTTRAGYGITDAADSAVVAAHTAETTTAHGGIVASTDSRLTDSRTPTTHSHPESDVTSLVSDLAAKATSASLTTHTALTTAAHGGIVASTDSRLTDSRTPTAHSHVEADVTALVADLAAKVPTARTLTINGTALDLSADRSWTVSGSADNLGLTPTAVKTSNYTAVAGDLVPCDTSGGAFAITFPTAPADRTVIAIKLVTAGNTLTLTLGGSDVFNKAGGPATGSLSLANQGIICQYKATGAIWYVVADDLSLSALDLRYVLAAAITGGGTLATGGFTLTVPATGTAALLGTANVFTQAQTINGANLGIAITGAASGGTPSIVASSPAVAASTAVGTPLQITASPAIAGSTNAGAAVGGDVTITAGAAARLTSGNANGGNINLTPGAAIGTGAVGKVVIGAFLREYSGGTFGEISGNGATNGLWLGNTLALGAVVVKTDASANDYLGLGSVSYVAFSSLSGGYQAIDTALRRNGVGVLEVSNGTSGQWGALKAGTRDAGTTTITDGLTLGHQSTGTPAAGLGIGVQLNINSSTNPDQSAARITAEWADATHATRKARAILNVFDTASREALRLEASGSAAMIGFLGASATARVAITGSRSANAALANLLTELAAKGLVTDSTTA